MPQEITRRDLRDESDEIMRRVEHGETFIITRHGTPVAELTPVKSRRFVAVDAIIAIFGNAPRIDAARLREDLDAVAAQDVTPIEGPV